MTPERVQVQVDPAIVAAHGTIVVPGIETESPDTERPDGSDPETVTSAAAPTPCSTTASIVVGVDRMIVNGFTELSMAPQPTVCETEIEKVPSGKSEGRA